MSKPAPKAPPKPRQVSQQVKNSRVIAKMQKQREKADADVLGVLTAQQKEKWTEMKGKEFKFPQPKFGPGGRGGPGGFGPGGPGKKPAEKSRPSPDKQEA